MSLASVRSSRGDSYELLIAARWAMRMLHDAKILQIDIDSTSLDGSGKPIEVDDIVVSLATGQTIYCQSKKNQQDFKYWSPGDLQDDLRKAARQLARDQAGLVQFYSATPFGDVAKLAEHAATQPNAPAYETSLRTIGGLRNINSSLESYWLPELEGTNISAFDLLRRVSFHSTSGLQELRQEILGTLCQFVTQADRVLEMLIGLLASLKSRTSASSGGISTIPTIGVTRTQLLGLLAEVGSLLTPPRAEQELLAEFRSASMVGRPWRRDIGSKRLSRKALDEVLGLVQSGDKRVLVTDGPGSGKTCLLLELADKIECDQTRALLFIQARIYSECRNPDMRRAMGLPDDVVEAVGRLSEYRPVVVIIDSLDVLSLAREHEVLNFFLGLIDRLSLIPRVIVVAACRNYDLKYDHRLKNRDWGNVVTLGMLDWETQVLPLLHEWLVDPQMIPTALRNLLANPRMLAIFEEIVRRGSIPTANTVQELTEHYLRSVVLNDKALGETAMAHLERLGREMLQLRQMSLPVVRANVPDALMQALMSAGVLAESGAKALTFGHQTLLDVLAVRAAYRDRKSLLGFISDQAATPFSRPAVRSFFFYLRSADPDGFRGQLRAALGNSNVAFHLKRLLTESMAEVEPDDSDWPLIQHIFRQHCELFPNFYFLTTNLAWFLFLEKHWWPVITSEKTSQWALSHARHLEKWLQQQPDEVLNAWLAMLELEWIPQDHLAQLITLALDDFDKWHSSLTRSLFEKLLPLTPQKHDFLGRKVGAWVEVTGEGDDLLWRFIIRDVTPEAFKGFSLDGKLRCAPHDLGSNQQLLAIRMAQSESLLSQAIDSVEAWSESINARWKSASPFYDHFLRKTSYGQTHNRVTHTHVDSEFVLFHAIEEACLQHAKADTSWWRENERRLRQSREAALRYIAIRAYTENASSNVESIVSVLADNEVMEYRWTFEIGKLLKAAFHMLDPAEQDRVIELLFNLHSDPDEQGEHQSAWIKMKQRDYLRMIPSFCLPPLADELLRDALLRYGPPSDGPHIEMRGGCVAPPFSDTTLLALTDETILQIVRHYDSGGRGDWDRDFLVGGSAQVTQVVHDAASKQPSRFMAMLEARWLDLPTSVKDAILSGISIHLRYRFGHLSSSTPWIPIETPAGCELASRLISELNHHSAYWFCKHETAEALEACSWVVDTQADAERLAFLMAENRFAGDPAPDRENGMGLIGIAINSTRGITADAAMILSTRWIEDGQPLPELLAALLLFFSFDDHPAIRAILARRLPILQQHSPEVGWRIFRNAMTQANSEMWQVAEPCLYYSYHSNFDDVAPWLDSVLAAGAGETWGRISALAHLSGHIPFEALTQVLLSVTDEGAWTGVSQVLSSNFDKHDHFEKCLAGLTWMMNKAPQPMVVESAILFNTFGDNKPPLRFPSNFLKKLFSVRNKIEQDHRGSLHGFMEWLEVLAETHIEESLLAAEIMLSVGDLGQDLDLWHLTSGSVLSRLFQEAEDREASDGGHFLRRVIAVQDVLLKSGTYGLDQWLKDAERP